MKRPRILIAEDRPFTRELLEHILTPAYDVVAVVGDGQSAVDAAAHYQPDVALLDIGMPVMDGLHAARLLKVLSPAVKLIFVSCHKTQNYLEEALRIGADGYVFKDRIVDELIDAIKVVCSGGTFWQPRP